MEPDTSKRDNRIINRGVYEQEKQDMSLSQDEKGQCLLCERNEVKYRFIKSLSDQHPIKVLCRVMLVSRSAYHDWVKRPATLITADELQLYRRIKQLFETSRGSLGSREMIKKLRKEGFKIGRYRVRSLMKRLDLKVTQRQAYRVTTQRKDAYPVAENLINQNFNPDKSNQVWAGDVTYLRTHEGWMYLAIIMDLYSRRIIGWSIQKPMTVNLASRAIQMAIKLRNLGEGLIFHSDQGSQYTSKVFGRLLKIYHLTRQGMKQDVEAYICYYNQDRLHTANGDLSPVEYELSQIKVSGWT